MYDNYTNVCYGIGKQINLQVPFMLQKAIDVATSAVNSGAIKAADGVVVKKVIVTACIASNT